MLVKNNELKYQDLLGYEYRCLDCWVCLVHHCGTFNNACLEMFGASHVVQVIRGTFITSWAVEQRQSQCPVLCCAECAVGARQRRARACLRHLPSSAAVWARPPSRRVVAPCRVTQDNQPRDPRQRDMWRDLRPVPTRDTWHCPA